MALVVAGPPQPTSGLGHLSMVELMDRFWLAMAAAGLSAVLITSWCCRLASACLADRSLSKSTIKVGFTHG